MSVRKTDPLLLAGRVLTIIMQAIMAFGAGLLTLLLPFIIALQGKITGALQEETGNPELILPVFSIIGVMAIGIAILVMLFIFFGKLRQIIGTVELGDPFQPDNADRLSRMGWLMLGVQIALIPAAFIGVYLLEFAQQFEGSEGSIDVGLDISGILLVIILFILARVFRKGTEMRDDLEGTV